MRKLIAILCFALSTNASAIALWELVYSQKLDNNNRILCCAPEMRDIKHQAESERSKIDKPPLGRRIIVMFFCVPFGWLVSAWGWEHFYEERRVLGASLVALGLLIVFGGVGLWLLNSVPLTWSWFL